MSRRAPPFWARLLLLLYPRDFREARGDEVLDFLTADLRRAEERGWVPWALATSSGAVDLALGALRLRLRPVETGVATGLLQDLRQTARGLLARPLVPVVIVSTLGVGVGLNTALFSVIDTVLLRPLDYSSPDRLALVRATVQMDDVTRTHFTGGDLRDLRAISAFEAVEGAAFIRQNLSGVGHPAQVGVGWSSAGLFQLLGVEAVLGRTYGPDDPMGTVVLTHDFWRDHFGSDRSILGSAIRLDGHPHTIVGVLPPDFRADLVRLRGDEVALWKNPDDFWQNGDLWGAQGPDFGGIVEAVGRLAPGATLDDADAGLAGVAEEWRARWPEWTERGLVLDAEPLHEAVVGEARTPLLLLMASVAVVLLIACANVMGILLVRTVRRRQDVALRVALGASTGRVVRWLLGESLLLSVGGGVAGLGLAWAGVHAFNRWGVALPGADQIVLDERVLAFALALTAICTILVGLVPALGVSRVGGTAALAGGRGWTGGGQALRRGLVVGQIAASLMLLVGAGLLGSTLVRLADVEPGFGPEGLVTFAVSLPGARYDWPEETNRFLRTMEERIDAVPGVERAGVGWPMPLSGSRWLSTYGVPGSALDDLEPLGDYRVVTPDYFETLRIPFVGGRTFESSDPRLSVVVSRRIAEAAWPEGGWVGRELQANPWGRGDVAFAVVGVVEDVRYSGLRDEPVGALYFDARGWSWADWEFHVLVRTDRAASDIIPELRDILADMDPEIPVAGEASMSELVRDQLASNRTALGLVGLFSVLACGLTLLGLYGVIAYDVRLRARELGIRIALGAARAQAVRLVLAHAVRLVLVGLALGLGGAVLLSGMLRTWLFGIEPTDPATYALVALGLGALAVAAAWLPARRAARLEPMEVLRTE